MKSSRNAWPGCCPRFSRSCGLTLLEILVSVAILAVVMTLVFPMLGGMTDRAKAAQCVSHLRTIYVAVQGYAADHNGMIIYGRGRKLSNPKLGDWYFELAANGYLEAQYPQPTGMGINDYALRAFPVLGCPVVLGHQAERVPGNQEGRKLTYGFNPALTNADDNVTRYFSQLTQPGKTLMLGDGSTLGGISRAYLNWASMRPGAEHGGKANLVFCDGHIDQWDPDTMPTPQDGNEGKLFWSGVLE